MSQNGHGRDKGGSRPVAIGDDQSGMTEIPSGDWSCIDEAADDFERAWKEGPRPAFEVYLVGVAEPRRSLLLHELLRVERELRLRDGEVPRPEDYHERSPGDGRDRGCFPSTGRVTVALRWTRIPAYGGASGYGQLHPPFSRAFWRDRPRRSAPAGR